MKKAIVGSALTLAISGVAYAATTGTTVTHPMIGQETRMENGAVVSTDSTTYQRLGPSGTFNVPSSSDLVTINYYSQAEPDTATTAGSAWFEILLDSNPIGSSYYDTTNGPPWAEGQWVGGGPNGVPPGDNGMTPIGTYNLSPGRHRLSVELKAGDASVPVSFRYMTVDARVSWPQTDLIQPLTP
jgi:hypothetical protein